MSMNRSQKTKVINSATKYFRDNIVKGHIENASVRASKLSEYNINPFLFKYLANFLTGTADPESIARALVLPRILGSSITTSFGMQIQKLLTEMFDGMGSMIPGIDIEYVDAIDSRKKYCQLKAGPNTINHDDVETVLQHFKRARNLARTNNLIINQADMLVGVVYGEYEDLSSHYKRIETDYPVIVGKNFWYRITGDSGFYTELIDAFGRVALDVDGRAVIQDTVDALAEEIREKYFQ